MNVSLQWADGEMRVVGVGLASEKRKEMYIPCPNKFPNAWIHPAGCQTGGCVCLSRPPSDSNVSWLAPEKQGTSKCMMTAALKIMTGEEIRSVSEGISPCLRSMADGIRYNPQLHLSIETIRSQALLRLYSTTLAGRP